MNFTGASGSNYLYTKDHLGSIRELTNSGGVIESQFSYGPWGVSTQVSGTGSKPDYSYAGMYVHARSGLNPTKYRAYNPNIGRWLARDPIGVKGGLNLYAYVDNNPLSNRDPLGLQSTAPTVPTTSTTEAFPTPKPGPNMGPTVALGTLAAMKIWWAMWKLNRCLDAAELKWEKCKNKLYNPKSCPDDEFDAKMRDCDETYLDDVSDCYSKAGLPRP